MTSYQLDLFCCFFFVCFLSLSDLDIGEQSHKRYFPLKNVYEPAIIIRYQGVGCKYAWSMHHNQQHDSQDLISIGDIMWEQNVMCVTSLWNQTQSAVTFYWNGFCSTVSIKRKIIQIKKKKKNLKRKLSRL